MRGPVAETSVTDGKNHRYQTGFESTPIDWHPFLELARERQLMVSVSERIQPRHSLVFPEIHAAEDAMRGSDAD